jgi:hypothetical protein
MQGRHHKLAQVKRAPAIVTGDMDCRLLTLAERRELHS